MTDAARILLVEPPGQFRDAVKRAVAERGAEATAIDDGMSVLAQLEALSPNIVVVGEAAGPPGADSLCRILERRFDSARVLRLGAGAPGRPDASGHAFVPRSLPADVVAARILQRDPSGSGAADAAAGHPGAFQLELGGLQVVQVLLALCHRRASGRLYVQADGVERRFELAWGVPVASAGGGLSERLGALAAAQDRVPEATLHRALDLAHASGMRLGEALRQLGALGAGELYQLLLAQHRLRIESASLAGHASVRFVPARLADLLSGVVATPVHPLTGLLSALTHTGADARKAVLARLASRQLVRGGEATEVRRLLSGLSLSRTTAQLERPSTVDALRRAVAEQLAEAPDGEALDADTLALALITSGVVVLGRGPTTSSLPPHNSDPLRAVTGLSALEVPGGDGPSQPPRDALERAAEMCFYGEGEPPDPDAQAAETPDAAHRVRQMWLHGLWPAAEPASGLHALYLDVMGARGPHPLVGADTQAAPHALRLALHARLDEIDRVLPAATGAEPDAPQRELMRIQLRSAVALAREQLPAPSTPVVAQEDDAASAAERTSGGSAAASTSPSEREPVPVDVDAARRAPAAADLFGGKPPVGIASPPPPRRPPPPPPSALTVPAANRQGTSSIPAEPGVSAEVESMVQQTRWPELIAYVEQQEQAPDALPPGLSLLYAIALKESQEPGSENAVSPDALGIKAVAKLLRVRASSPAALVIAKRALRKRPLEWSKQPTRKVSITAVLVALMIGATVGLLMHGFSPF